MPAILGLVLLFHASAHHPRYTITTPLGAVTGFCAPNRACSFLGIPYAHVVRRFFPAVALSHRTDTNTLDATSDGPMCVQSNFLWMLQEAGTEQCLNLNIWVPRPTLIARVSSGGNSGAGRRPTQGAHKLPVFVFVHGGFGYFGSNSQRFWNGDKFAISGHVSGGDGDDPPLSASKIVVAVNYRLGIFGMFASARIKNETGATGAANHLRDVILALEWIKDNIASFGGNPDRITLVGESSGATFTCALLASKRIKGLVLYAGVQSGVCLGPASDAVLSQNESYTRSQWLLDQMGVTEHDLHTMPAMEIQALSDPLATDLLTKGPALGVDGYVLQKRPLIHDMERGFPSEVQALFWGYTSLDEPSEPYAPHPGAVPFLSMYFGNADAQKLVQQYNTSKPTWVQNMLLDGCLRCRTLQIVQVSNRAEIPSYAYEYDAFPNQTLHMWDLFAIFNHYPTWDPLFGYVSQLIIPDKIPRKTRMLVQNAWSSFMYSGNPANGFKPTEVNRITKDGLVYKPLEKEACWEWIEVTDRAGEETTARMCVAAADALSNMISSWAVTALCAIVPRLSLHLYLRSSLSCSC
eukprot:GEMP01023214.1.p1 GENE.GEMP01023214.1~~GEMP01023214.1.p1  ORF type:complete len:579 (+),score=110.17 GEMP01023214.1:71-1807(+)